MNFRHENWVLGSNYWWNLCIVHRLSLFSWRHCTSSHDCNEEVEKRKQCTRTTAVEISWDEFLTFTNFRAKNISVISFNWLNWLLFLFLIAHYFILNYFKGFKLLKYLKKLQKCPKCPAFVEIGLLKSDWVQNGPNEETRAIIEVKFFSKGLLWFDFVWQVTGKVSSYR